ncbi:hypothetical protein WBU96_28540 [Bacillus albus]|uniref:hypothetical protein n=1 Tax=Bacillus albus TaxID=2026189 RepID=UPI0030153376
MKLTKGYSEKIFTLTIEQGIEPKYFAICDYGVTGVAAIIVATDDQAAERFYDNVVGSDSPLCQKFGCTAMEVGLDNAMRARGVGVKVYDAFGLQEVSK